MRYYYRNSKARLAYAKEYRSRPEIKKMCYERHKNYMASRPEYSLLKLAGARAKRQGRKFTIKLKDICIPKKCPILGIRLKRGRGKRHDGSPSLDRVNNSKGYIKGNIRVISWKANSLKRNLTLSNVKKLYKYMTGAI